VPSAVVDLFCGIGGLTHGLELAGLNVVAGIDVEASCRYAYERNNHSVFVNRDIAEITAEELLSYYPEDCTRILVGCAPCQPFSKYTKRYRKNGHKDDKWRLLYEFSRLVEQSDPVIVSMENVPELSKEPIFDEFVNMLKEKAYKTYHDIVFCPDYGVPQNRKRLVLLASKLGEIALIDPLYDKTNYVTVRQAIGELPALSDGECDANDIVHRAGRLSNTNKSRIRQSVPGGTWRDWDAHLRLKCHQKNTGKSYPSVYGRMHWDEPSPTITTQFYGLGNGRFGHPEQHRALSIREGAMLQSFPQNYSFTENETQFNKRVLGTHIGNAVPVALASAIGASIEEHLRRHEANGQENQNNR
jgi:DNA (cytosine-5)-methyltransferase 1